MKNIILCSNVTRDKNMELAEEVKNILEKSGVTPVICSLQRSGSGEGARIDTSGLLQYLDSADMIITFGGDGTILQTARAIAGRNIPILGINLGDKGFMTELERDEIGLIPKVLSGEYKIEERMMLDVSLERDGQQILTDFALNDVIINGHARVIEIIVFGDGRKISHFLGDGTIIATPTGSTAYSMSAGGPIVEPTAKNIIVTPICAHVLYAKSFVLASDRNVTVELGHDKKNPAYLSVDGADSICLCSGDVIHIGKSNLETRFLRISNKSFYEKVGEKLGEKK